MRGSPQPSLRRVLLSAAAAMAVGLGAVSVAVGFSDSVPVRLLQGVAVFAAGAVIIGGAVVLALVQLAGWREPESEEFDKIVERAERLASEGDWAPGDSTGDDDDDDDDEDDDYALSTDEDFRALVRAAVDELPLEFHRALEHVAIVVLDEGGRRRAPTGSTRATPSPATTSTTGS